MNEQETTRRARPSEPLPSRPRLRRVAAGGALISLLCALGPAEAYRFFDRKGEDEPLSSWRLVPAADALRWSPDRWGPGETLAWEVAPDPDFEAWLFEDTAEALPYIESAMTAWMEIGTADISWKLEGVGREIDEIEIEDERNSIFIDAESPAGGYAALWSERDSSGGLWEMTECDIALGSWAAEPPSWVPPEALDEFRGRFRDEAVYVLVHEFGHCLGLAHAGAVSITGRQQQDAASFSRVHPGDPAMSYGVVQSAPTDLADDDVVGASLLRPAAGWQAKAGSISGTLILGAEPAAWVHVWALPAKGDAQRDRVGAFSDEGGRFLIEGLQPGDYTLWAHNIVIPQAHSLLMFNGAPLDLDDTLRGRLVRVEAGAAGGGMAIPMRIGRTGRPPPDSGGASRKPRSSITDTWGVPCPDIRVRAERPYPADGPRAAAIPDEGLAGDIWLTTELVMEWGAGSEDVVFDWTGMYRSWIKPRWRERIVYVNPPRTGSEWLDLSIAEWKIEREGSVVRHSLELAWPESARAGLRLRSSSGGCPSEPMVVCDPSGCGITP